MSEPRQFIRGGTYFITRRCTQRQFLLRPSKQINAVLRFCLAAAAQRFGVRIHAFVFLSNHYHLVATDRNGRLLEFVAWLNTHISKCLNLHHGRSENLFDSRQAHIIPIATASDVFSKMVYVLANPVAAGLVSRGELWPGLRSDTADVGRTLRAEKPKVYFRREENDGAAPDLARFDLEVPPGFEHLTVKQFRRELAAAVEAREAELRTQLRAEGRSVLGVRGVKAVSPFDSPRQPAERGGRVPRLVCKDPELRKTLLERLKEFLVDYREALEAYCAGRRRTEFPAGTYWMRVQFGVDCWRASPLWRIRARSG